MKIHLILLGLVLSLPLVAADKNPLLPKEESAKFIEAAIRKSLKKPKGGFTKADLEKVRELRLERSPVTDEGLKEAAKLSQLSKLYLRDTKITDVGLKEVAKCNKLKVFRCEGTKITIAGVVGLQKALPKCKILHNPKK